jgi:hypothetical protein
VTCLSRYSDEEHCANSLMRRGLNSDFEWDNVLVAQESQASAAFYVLISL